MGCCGHKSPEVRRAVPNIPMPRVIKPSGMHGLVGKLCPKCKYPMSRIARKDPTQNRLIMEYICMRRGCGTRI